MRINPTKLAGLVSAIFGRIGCRQQEADCVADHLINANLAGHDSHGVIRVSHYARWVREEKVFPNRHAQVLFQSEAIAVVDGQLGFGQSIGVEVMQLGIEVVAKHGVAVVALRNSGHLGRIGHWAEMAAAANLISLHFVNTSGLGMLVAPVGGIERRLSANPVAAGIPIDGGQPLIYDISTSSIAEGKLKVAFNKGVAVPAGCIIDPQGQPTDDPKVFYGTPPGAILPFGGHKGYGLGLVAEILAGALTGGGCSKPGVDRLEQGMLTVLLDPKSLQVEETFSAEVQQFIAFVKSSEKASPDSKIFIPGEIEYANRTHRLEQGIELDSSTWRQLSDTAREEGLSDDTIQSVV